MPYARPTLKTEGALSTEQHLSHLAHGHDCPVCRLADIPRTAMIPRPCLALIVHPAFPMAKHVYLNSVPSPHASVQDFYARTLGGALDLLARAQQLYTRDEFLGLHAYQSSYQRSFYRYAKQARAEA